MKSLFFTIILFLNLLSLNAQTNKYVLMVDVEQNENSEKRSCLVIHTKGHDFLIEPDLTTRN